MDIQVAGLGIGYVDQKGRTLGRDLSHDTTQQMSRTFEVWNLKFELRRLKSQIIVKSAWIVFFSFIQLLYVLNFLPRGHTAWPLKFSLKFVLANVTRCLQQTCWST